jgi:hypothetical protein
MNAKRWLLPGCLFLALPLAAAPAGGGPGKDKDGFVPLFNGKDLSGWMRVNCAPSTFVARDNMIVTTGVPTGVLRTARQYENFILELEWKHIKPKGNSGLFVWSDPLPAVGVPFTRAIEVQILDGIETKNYTSDGDLFSIWGATLTPDRPHPSGWKRCLPSEKRCKPAGQWNHYRVECNDGVIKLAVNGKVVSGGSKCSPRKGYLCLEAEGSECHFRNLRIKELPSTNPKAEDVADVAQGFVPLLTGLDLTGWKQAPGDKGHWQPRSGPNTLSHDGKGKGALIAQKEHGDFELICDWRWPGKAGGTSGLRLRGSDRAVVRMQAAGGSGGVGDEAPRVKADSPPGRWNRFVIALKRDHLTVRLNGKMATDARVKGLPAKGPLVLEGGSPVELTNLFVRELK